VLGQGLSSQGSRCSVGGAWRRLEDCPAHPHLALQGPFTFSRVFEPAHLPTHQPTASPGWNPLPGPHRPSPACLLLSSPAQPQRHATASKLTTAAATELLSVSTAACTACRAKRRCRGPRAERGMPVRRASRNLRCGRAWGSGRGTGRVRHCGRDIIRGSDRGSGTPVPTATLAHPSALPQAAELRNAVDTTKACPCPPPRHYPYPPELLQAAELCDIIGSNGCPRNLQMFQGQRGPDRCLWRQGPCACCRLPGAYPVSHAGESHLMWVQVCLGNEKEVAKAPTLAEAIKHVAPMCLCTVA